MATKPRSRKKKIIAGVLGGVTLGGIAYGVYSMSKHKKNDKNTDKTTDTASTTSASDGEGSGSSSGISCISSVVCLTVCTLLAFTTAKRQDHAKSCA